MLTASAGTFAGPSLENLIVLARQGKDTAPAAIHRMLKALETQLTSGPLAELQAGTVDGNGFVTEVQSVESSYEQNVNGQLLPEFPNVDTLLVLQGQRIVADESALNQQNTVGLLSSSQFTAQAQTAINSLTAGPLYSLHTPLSGYATATQNFENSLTDIANGLNASVPLTPAEASTTMLADTVAYQADIHAALQVTHPNISNTVDQAVASLISTANSIATDSSNSDAATQITTAINAFDTAILDTTGVFGPQGVIAVSLATGRGFGPHLTDHRESSSLTSVSGTASLGGTATLTATLTSSSGQAISGVAVSFTLDGAFAGVADTDSSGVATLSGVPTSDSVGTDTGGVAAFFAGNMKDKSSTGTGDLTVTQADTSLTSVAGTASFGGTATLTATLTSAVTGQPISGETVGFTLDGTSVGSASTDSSGIATLTGVATTDAVGTHTGVVAASFAGDSTAGYNASSGTGDLVVSPADTTLASVSGSATYGGTATLTATLTSNVTSAGIANETVSFTLNGTSVGTASTSSSGVATLTGVATTDAVGSYPGAVVASFAGDSNYNAATNATGTLTVTQAGTTTTAVSGTASFGGTATLTATLTSTETSAGIANETVDFTLDGTSVGNATTNSSGVATLTGVATSDPVGTDPNGVAASFAGDSNYTASNGTGDLTVTPAGVTFASVAGTGTVASGTATLTATLTSAVTGAALSGVTVNFTLGTTTEPATTDSNGVATVMGVAIPASDDSPGSYPGAVAVAFAGNTDYNSGNATGTLTVS
ncbi:MAG: beta strand repeat-containing protein [Isosphaeraceae bacterium]